MSVQRNIFTFDFDEMLRDFARFDAYEYRYAVSRWERAGANSTDAYRLRMFIESWESAYRPMDKIEYGFGNILEELKLIYGDGEPIQKFIHLYDTVSKKVVVQYLGIKSLLPLFNWKYFEYEWEMHLALDYKSRSQSFYRDHFIHQIRVAYEAMRLLYEIPELLNGTLKILTNANNMVGEYTRRYAAKEYLEISENPTSREIFHMLFGENFNVSRMPYNPGLRGANEETRKHIYKNIAKSALIIAGLFHDIGYPIHHTVRKMKSLPEFIPTADFFTGLPANFDEILGTLADSLLFRTVGAERLRRLYEAEAHGTASALALLLHFYRSGAIHDLRPAKRAALELAGLIISDHTNPYGLLGDKLGDKPAPYHRTVNYRNPLAFLLRFCDDIQEWGRVYFFVDSSEPLRICNHCHMPIVSYKSYMGTKTEAICGCADTKSDGLLEFNNSPVAEIADMSHRNVHHIEVSERVRMYRVPPNTAEENYFDGRLSMFDFLPTYGHRTFIDDSTNPAPKREPNDYNYLLHIDYDLFKLLQLAIINPSFSKIRAEEINKLKKLLDGNEGFPRITIFSDVVTNPIAIKAKIIERFISNLHSRFVFARGEYLRVVSSNAQDDKEKGSCELLNMMKRCAGNGSLIIKSLSDANIAKDNARLIINMLLFSNKKYSVSEIIAVLDEREREGSNSGESEYNARRRLLKLYNDNTREKVEINRFLVCVDAYELYKLLADINESSKSGSSKNVAFSIFERIVDNLYIGRKKLANFYPATVRTKIKSHLKFYFELLYDTKTFLGISVKEKAARDERFTQLLNDYCDDGVRSCKAVKSFPDDSLIALVREFLIQESRHIDYFNTKEQVFAYPEEYYKINEQTQYIAEMTERYTDVRYGYKQFIDGKNSDDEDYLDLYSDLYIFYKLAKAAQ